MPTDERIGGVTRMRGRRVWRWLAPGAAACAALLVSACASAPSSPSGADTSPLATATATVSTLGGTPLPASGGAAVLGGNLSAFVGKYGQPDSLSDPTNGRYNFGDGRLAAYTDVFAGDPYAHRVLGVDDRAPAGQPWSPTAANRLCTSFSPTDARFVGELPITGSQGLAGVDEVYQSASLARAFPAARFLDASGNPTQPGSFDIEYLYPAVNQSGSYASCALLIGTQHTNGEAANASRGIPDA
jgi:hypothetical protein